MSDRQDTQSTRPPEAEGGSAMLETAAELLGSFMRLVFRASAFPALLLKYLPESELVGSARDVARTAAVFPRAVAQAISDVSDEVEGVGGAVSRQPATEVPPPFVQVHRQNKTETAILFIHGFGFNSKLTWADFPRFLAGDKRLDGWDIYSVGYSTSLWLDLAGLWTASPPISRLAVYLRTLAGLPPFDGYKSLAIVAHSMGGLVVQQALVEDPGFLSRVGHLICFGTPSNGLLKAGFLRWWKLQVRDMAADSPFVTALRQLWRERIGEHPTFKLQIVAGDEDELVPSTSSLEPFPKVFQAVIPGNHVTIVQPKRAADPNVQLVFKVLMGEAAPAGPWNSARVAVEQRDFQRAINELWPLRAELDDATLILLALALDSVGRRDDSIQVLLGSRQQATDAMGTLAGRFKRRWRQQGRLEDGQRAQELYRQALATAEANQDPAQSFYLAINVAFMDLAFDRNLEQARQSARCALGHCARAYRDVWCLATEGEAYLYLGQDEESLEGYREALAREPQPWQVASMFHQAVAVAELLDNETMAERLRELFRSAGPETRMIPPAGEPATRPRRREEVPREQTATNL
jgi:pimeloyl-ACP methyl ester carboxylesterase